MLETEGCQSHALLLSQKAALPACSCTATVSDADMLSDTFATPESAVSAYCRLQDWALSLYTNVTCGCVHGLEVLRDQRKKQNCLKSAVFV